MSKALLAGSAMVLFLTLAGCSQKPQVDDSASAPAPPAPVRPQPASEAKPTTETAAFSGGDGGAYGMPRAPIPYDQLSRYERQQEALGGGQPPEAQPPEGPAGAQARPQPYREPAKRLNPKTRRESDAVFY
jgi:hypothetical protein